MQATQVPILLLGAFNMQINGVTVSQVGTDGWTNPLETWTFASATTINVPDGTKYQKGDFFKFTQSGTVKYFVVVGIASNVLTLCSQDSGVTTTVANAAITANYFSRQANPAGLPVFTWAAGWTGFGTAPSNAVTKWWTVGATVFVSYWYNSAVGISNATTFTITGLPISALVATNEINIGFGQDNSLAANTITGSISGTTLSLFKDQSLTVWTAANNKGVYNFVVAYQF